MTKHEKELTGNFRAFLLFDEFLSKNIIFDDYAVTYGKCGNDLVKANIRLFNRNQYHKNRPVYRFEIGYPNIINNACFDTLLKLITDYINSYKEVL